jgi:phage major head subunit gpT-like protein
MGVINTGSFAKALLPGVKKWYGEGYDELPEVHTKIFTKTSSSRAWEEYVGFSGFGLMVEKPEGSDISFDEAKQGFVTRLTNVSYGLGFVITWEMYQDDQYGVIGKKKAKALGFSVRQTQEYLGHLVLNRAFNSSYTGGDGVEMVSTAHINKAGGTWSNEIATAADLSYAALQQADIDIMAFKDDRGLQINVQPRKLVVPKELKFEAAKILKTLQEPDTADNNINTLRSEGVIPEGFVWTPYLTDSDAWFVLTNIPGEEGLIYQEREAPNFDVADDSDTRNAKYLSFFRGVWGWVDPRAIYGSAGA